MVCIQIPVPVSLSTQLAKSGFVLGVFFIFLSVANGF